MAKQSIEDRLARLAKGRCPIHGIGMSQQDDWFYDENFDAFYIVGCPRDDCDVQGISYDPYGSVRLFGAHMDLIGKNPTPDPRNRRVDAMVADLEDKELIKQVFHLSETYKMSTYGIILNAARFGMSAVAEALEKRSKQP